MTTEAHQNGGQPPQNVPGLRDVMVQAAAQKPNLLMELITTSTKAEHFLPQAILTQEDLDRYRRIQGQENAWKTGNADMDHLQWQGLAGSLAVDARARTHLTDVVGGRNSLIGTFMSRVFGRASRQPRQRDPEKTLGG